MSDLSTMIKRLLLPVIFTTAAFHMPVQANTVRIIGPSADEQSAFVAERTQSAATQNGASVTRYGPTRGNETLWSIASRSRPNNQVSVYQVIGAIHRANPSAFEQNNIHGLIPDSTLVMPTLAQIRREDVDSVKRRLEADKRRQSRQASTPAPRSSTASTPAPKPRTKPAPTVVAAALPKPDKAKEQPVSQTTTKPNGEAVKPPVSEIAKGGIPAKPVALQQQLDASDEQITKLLESNHLLRVRLSEMQHEVTALKDQISSDEVLREQIKDFIQEQKVQQPQPVAPQPSWFDSLIASPWMLAAVALIPGALIAGVLAFFMLRRKKEDETKALEGPEAQEPAMVPPPVNSGDEAVPDLPLNDDNDIDDLFADDGESLFDEPENSLFSAETSLDSDEQSDSIDILELGDDHNDEFEIDSGLSTSSISVKGDEQAIGLQDMERALDEMEQTSEPSSDEALAAMWEQSLQDDADDEESFDLSDDGSLNALDDDLMTEQEIEDGLLDQSILDDLLSEVEAEKQMQDSQSLKEAAADNDTAASDASQQVIAQDELDSLFDSVGTAEVAEPPAKTVMTEGEDKAQQAAIDQALADADAMFAAEAEAISEDDIGAELDALFDENSTALLDELVEEEPLSSDTGEIEVEENSTALLDELIEEDELTSDIEVEENSTALLDELLDGDEEDSSLLNPSVSIDENSTALLDELVDELDSAAEDNAAGLADIAEEPELNIDDVVIDESSTELLDDILAQHSSPLDVATRDDMFAEPLTSSPELLEPESTGSSFIDANQSEAISSEEQYPEPPLAESQPSEDNFSEPEFESVPENDELLTQQPEDIAAVAFEEAFSAPSQEPSLETVDDADFPELDKPDFEDIFNDVLEEQANQDSVEPVTEALQPEVETVLEPPLEAPQQGLNDSVEAEDIDALLADVEGLLDEPEVSNDNDVEVIERSVDELLENIEHEQDLQPGLQVDEQQHEAPAAVDERSEKDVQLQPESDLELGLEQPEQPELAVAVPQDDTSRVQTELEESVLSGEGFDEFPTFDEEVALAESESLVEPQIEPLDVADAEPLNLDDFPEFDEEAAFNDPEAETFEETPVQLSDDEEQVALDNIVKQLQQAAEAAEKPLHIEQPDNADLASEPVFDEQVEQPEASISEQQPASIHGEQQIEFETIDPNSLPEFSENEALQASFEEQHELEQYELEQGLNGQPEPQPTAHEPQPPADMFDDELVDSAGLDMAALLSDPDSVIDDIQSDSEMVLPERVIESPVASEPEVATEFDEPVKHEVDEASISPLPEDVLSNATGDEIRGDELAADSVISDETLSDSMDNDAAAFAEAILDEAAPFTANTDFAIQDELDAEREQLLSASFGESFGSDEPLAELSDSELGMPEEDSEIWAASSPEPELETEDWAEQPQMQIEDVDAFDAELLLAEAESQGLLQGEAGSELVDEQINPSSYISIDELMKEMEPENSVEVEDEPLNLDVGLDEFPDVLSDVAAFDVDSQGEYASKLDLAKAYLEMNDTEGAADLLVEVANNGDAQSKREAKGLLEKVGLPRA
ncbi:hypothetical protein MD588_05525 [Photobacterium sp. SDRW27]|uniref:FimV/HubP family polar landmark protein n=1 Tax=Photobacterium obscurum TaxID=2829490 RepID=UPI0022433099|nr:FimV/HubP family polar landmark protein [Photobacterium obscurum]MCW8328264.1 hypothetical protein [Photobacterium obscurum]